MSENTNDTNSYTISSNDCPYRLPCGVCEKLSKECPKATYKTTYDTVAINYINSTTQASTLDDYRLI